MTPLSAAAIAAAMKAMGSVPPPIEVVASIDSTNRRLLEDGPVDGGWHALLTEEQTAGRGRRGRRWQGSRGGNLAMSVGWSYSGPLSRLPPLSLVVGVAVARAIESLYGAALRLKWPNDILLEQKKLGGILVETRMASASGCWVVIGIGINGRLDVTADGVDQPWADLCRLTGPGLDRNRLAAAILQQLQQMLPLFRQQGFAPFRPGWCRRAAWLGETVVAGDPESAGSRITGRLVGVDETGRLRLETGSAIESVAVGSVSLRRSVS